MRWISDIPLHRRAFVRTAAQGCAVLFAGGAGFGRRGQEELRIGLITREGGEPPRGLILGLEEAARTGGLMGRTIALISADSIAGVEHLVRERDVAALVGGWDEASCLEIGAAADAEGVPFLNTGCRSDALRGAECRRAVFHVEASEAMYAAALAARAGDAGDAAEAVLWHPSLERFGAGQVNDRFRARFGGAGMEGADWAGWMAVKVLWEASLRARSTEPGAIREYLERDGTQFDGHKGWPLSFRPWDHQLRQPLYLLSADGARVVGEVPVRPAEGASSSREMLDVLAGDASVSACRVMPAG